MTNTTTTTKYWRADIGNKSCITWEEEVEQISLKKERDEDRSQWPPYTYSEQDERVLTLGLKGRRGRK